MSTSSAAQTSSPVNQDLASVEYAAILPDGSLGPWQFTAALTAGRANAVALIHGSFVYVVGGYGGGQLKTIERAEILAGGSLGPWSVLASTLTIPRERPGAAIVDATMVVIGGLSYTGGGIVRNTEFAAILADETLGAWQVGPLLTVPRYHLSAAGVAGVALALGGYNDGQSSAWATTEESPVGSTGPDEWASGPSLQETRAGLASAVAKGHVYVSGGIHGLFAPPWAMSATVERAAFAPLDTDQDGIPDAEEACMCLGTLTGQAVTAVGCSVAQVCPCNAPLGREAWRNHAEYLVCVKGATNELVADGVLTNSQRKALVRQAKDSTCGSNH